MPTLPGPKVDGQTYLDELVTLDGEDGGSAGPAGRAGQTGVRTNGIVEGGSQAFVRLSRFALAGVQNLEKNEKKKS
jgi:hypothetical protein